MTENKRENKSDALLKLFSAENWDLQKFASAYVISATQTPGRELATLAATFELEEAQVLAIFSSDAFRGAVQEAIQHRMMSLMPAAVAALRDALVVQGVPWSSKLGAAKEVLRVFEARLDEQPHMLDFEHSSPTALRRLIAQAQRHLDGKPKRRTIDAEDADYEDEEADGAPDGEPDDANSLDLFS